MDPERYHPRLCGLEHVASPLPSQMIKLVSTLQGSGQCGRVLCGDPQRNDSVSLDPLLGLCVWGSLSSHTVEHRTRSGQEQHTCSAHNGHFSELQHTQFL